MSFVDNEILIPKSRLVCRCFSALTFTLYIIAGFISICPIFVMFLYILVAYVHEVIFGSPIDYMQGCGGDVYIVLFIDAAGVAVIGLPITIAVGVLHVAVMRFCEVPSPILPVYNNQQYSSNKRN